jgi:hypothetical protein
MQKKGYETFLAIHDAIMGYPKKLLALIVTKFLSIMVTKGKLAATILKYFFSNLKSISLHKPFKD